MNDSTREMAEEPLEIRKKVVINIDATLGRLTSLIMRMPDEVPNEAEVTNVVPYIMGVDLEGREIDHEYEGPHEHREMLAVELEWAV